MNPHKPSLDDQQVRMVLRFHHLRLLKEARRRERRARLILWGVMLLLLALIGLLPFYTLLIARYGK